MTIYTPLIISTVSGHEDNHSFSKENDFFFREKENKKLLLDLVTGNCGNNIEWSLDTSNGLLSLTGSGEMSNYSYQTSPFYSYRNTIKSITIPNSVTSIGNFAFSDCYGLQLNQ